MITTQSHKFIFETNLPRSYTVCSMAHLHSDVRYRSSLVSITDIRCRPSTGRLSAEEQATTPELVLPRAGVFVKHVRDRQVVANANHVLFFNANEVYRVSHPAGGGDDCTSLVFDHSVIAEAKDMYDRVVCADPQRPYQLGQGLLSLQTIACQQRLRQRLNDSSGCALEFEELALELLHHVLRDVDA